MKLLAPLLLRDPILRTRPVHRPQRRRQIKPPVRLDMHLPAQTRPQLQFHARHGPVALGQGGVSHGAGEGVGAVGVGWGGWVGAEARSGLRSLLLLLLVLVVVAVAEAQVAYDLVEFGLALLSRFCWFFVGGRRGGGVRRFRRG